MNLRSRGPSNLVPIAADIRALERECARNRREEEQQAHLQRLSTDMGDIPQNQQRAARPIGTYDRPNIHGHRLGIRAPAVAANNFEIKSGLLNVIENNKYHGLALEDPFDHLDRFDSYCGLSKTNGVSEDALKLKLFPFSLGDKARQWEKSLPSDSITTWDDCKKAFLEKFFSTSRTAKLRNEISSFQQKNLEGFSEAWERFKGYQAQCPHHGFSKESLLSTFYRGALPKYRARLDTASNGFFLGRTEEDAEELVDNMVKSDAVYSGDHDRSSRTEDKQTRKELKALQDKIDILLADKATQEQLHFVGNPSQETPAIVHEVEGLEGQEELCFINNNGSWYKKEPNFQYNNYQQKSYSNNQQSGYPPRNNQQGSYQPQQNPSSGSSAPQESSTDTLLKQILESQTRSEKQVGYELKNLHSKIDGSYNELNNKFSHLASTVRNLENQFASMNTHQNRQQGSLPGKSDQNPKEAKAITLRSGKQLPPRTLTKDAEKLGEGVAINIDDEVVIVDEKINDEILEKIVEAKGKGKVGEEKKTVKDGEVVTPASESSFVPPPYEPKLPFPGRFKKQLLEKYKALFEKQMSEAQVAMPIIDAFMLIPQYNNFLKDVVAAKKKEMESMMNLTHECNAIIQRLDVPEKLEDPGSFTLPCALGPMVFEKSLCDLGASVSLMPLSVAKKLGFTQYKKCRLSLVLADRSVKYPVGILEDLPVKIGRYEIPTDFVVLEMGEEAQDPLILGRPFLATAGAIVNVKEGTIDLHLGKENILHFDIKRKMRKPTVFGQAFYIEEMDTPADEHLEELPPEDDEEGASPSTHSL
ncbi:hypothetical protein YC2023_109807 [Brassica napus]